MMAYLACVACGRCILEQDCGCSEHVRKRFEQLEERCREAEGKTYDMREAIKWVMKSVCAEAVEGQQILPVPRSALDILWKASGIIHPEPDADRWYSGELSLMMISSLAFQLFYSKPNGMGQRLIEEKLTNLYQKCKEYCKFMGWDDNDDKFDVTPEKFLKNCVRESRKI